MARSRLFRAYINGFLICAVIVFSDAAEWAPNALQNLRTAHVAWVGSVLCTTVHRPPCTTPHSDRENDPFTDDLGRDLSDDLVICRMM